MATMIERDVIVVGAGPAGSICASYMARAGLDVLLIDKEIFPRGKVCGDLVREGLVRHIERLEAVDVLDESSSCLRKIKLVSGAGCEAIVPYECYTTPRYNLDKILADTAVSWGVELRQGCRVLDVITEGDAVKGVVVKEKGVTREIRSKFVIAADGVNSVLAKTLDDTDEKPSGIWLGIRAYFKGVKIDKRLSKDQYDAGGIFGFDNGPGPAYFWVVPVGENGVKRGICNVGMLVRGRDAYSGQDLQDRLKAWLGKCAELQGAEKLGEWRFGKFSDNTIGRENIGEGYIFIGDAAAKADPLFGDGLAAAADTAKAAADAVETGFRADDFSVKTLAVAYEKSLDKLCSAKTADERKIDKLLLESMSDPRVMDKIIEKLGRDPSYAKNVL